MIEALNAEHARYRDRKEMWSRYWDFYVGGEQLRRNAARYLVRRQKEPGDVYSERLTRVFYENYLGSCIDWFAAALFRSQPGLIVQSADANVRSFYADFVEDCDCRGSGLLETARKAFVETLVFGESYVLIDFPRATEQVRTRAEEDASGRSRAHLASFSPLDLINWKADSYGDFDWVVLRNRTTYQESFAQPESVTEDRWLYYDRENYKVYRRRVTDGKPESQVELLDQGRHGLAEERVTPLVRIGVSEGLWLANKSALLVQEHFNKSNALSWALHMGLFAMPVIYSEREWQQIVGEAYYIQLGPQDRFGWTEPEGKVFQIAADNLDRLKDEIYRVCYLMTQAGGREARNLGQSGASKRRDFAVTQEVLRAYGTTVKEFLGNVLKLVAKARRDDVRFEVSGLDRFDALDFEEELGAAAQLREIGIRSPRFEREMQKRLALRYLDSATQETKNAVIEEIDAGVG